MPAHSDSDAVLDKINTGSRPSDLKITDMRIAVVGDDNWRWPIIRIYTNQGLIGLGEVRDGASARYALMLKSRILGENPTEIDRIFRKLKQFGGDARLGGGVCGIEMALMDLAGKAYNVPAYMFAGGKFRDSVRCYADTPALRDPKAMGEALKGRMERGFTFLKMDIGTWIAEGIEGGLNYPSGMLETTDVSHPLTGIQITDRGIAAMQEYVATVRDIIGYQIPLASDHFGHIGLESCIKVARALDQFSLAWYEDMIPWQYTDQWKRLAESCTTPVCTGEDIYLKEGFKPLLDSRAVGVIHPDLATSGGILETKKIGDYAQEHGVMMALHQAGSPVVAMANVHCALATENFMALEMHSVDNPWWDDLVEGVGKPIVENGYIKAPEGPGLGIVLNEEAVEEHLSRGTERFSVHPGMFEPTDEWDSLDAHDRTWS